MPTVLEKGTKIGKSDKDILNQFVKDLPSSSRTHTIAQGPHTFQKATKCATLNARAFGQEDNTITVLHQDSQPKQDNKDIP